MDLTIRQGTPAGSNTSENPDVEARSVEAIGRCRQSKVEDSSEKSGENLPSVAVDPYEEVVECSQAEGDGQEVGRVQTVLGGNQTTFYGKK